MVINKPGAVFEYEGVKYVIGTPIIGTNKSEYHGLYGIITEIRNGSDKETENETLDLYCEFEVPVLPHEIERIEAAFSDLYEQPKTIDDITLDCVIMAPKMVRPLDDLSGRKQMAVYIVSENWIVNGDAGNSIELFESLDDARRVMHEKLCSEIAEGCISQWRSLGQFAEDSSLNNYEGYLDGEYMDNHYSISIATHPLIQSE